MLLGVVVVDKYIVECEVKCLKGFDILKYF